MKIIRRNVFRFEMGHDGCTINENVKTDSKFVQHFCVKKEEKKTSWKKSFRDLLILAFLQTFLHELLISNFRISRNFKSKPWFVFCSFVYILEKSRIFSHGNIIRKVCRIFYDFKLNPQNAWIFVLLLAQMYSK